MPTPARNIQAVYHITHIKNVRDILRDGIWSHNKTASLPQPPKKIYDEEIVTRRAEKKLGEQSLSDFANFYFQPRNPMLYLVSMVKKEDVVVLRLRRDILSIPGAHISIGNAANDVSEFYTADKGVRKLQQKSVWEKIHAEYWNDFSDGKRMIMSELLVPDCVPSELIDTIYVPSIAKRNELKEMGVNVNISPEPHMFFLPTYGNKITNNVSLVEGDMFFSSMHTFTISVNTKGIMGKGLASRTKYQFPDVYVKYQDVCRNKSLTPEKPFLYKRESSVEKELSDAPEYLKNPNAIQWFLLFATKRDWHSDSRMEDIEAGMRWIEKNYKREGINSLALPALGCGLGGLQWREVGPLMCQTLARLSIHSTIYLPREGSIPNEQKSPDFLLGKKD